MNKDADKRLMKIVEKTKMNHDTFLIKVESSTPLPRLKSCCSVRIYDDNGESRPYSPISGTTKHLVFAMKEYPNGNLSKYICNKQVNDELLISEFLLRRENKMNEFKNVLMIAGGTGITPFYQMLHETFAYDMNNTDFTLLFLNKTKSDMFLLPQLERLKKKSGGKLHLVHVFSQELTEPETHQVCKKLSKDSLLKITHSKLFEFVYICGPPSLYESLSGPKISRTEQGPLVGILEEIGYKESQVYKL